MYGNEYHKRTPPKAVSATDAISAILDCHEYYHKLWFSVAKFAILLKLKTEI